MNKLIFLLIVAVVGIVLLFQGSGYADEEIEDMTFQQARDRYEHVRSVLRSSDATEEDKQAAYQQLEALRDRMNQLRDQVINSPEPTYMQMALQPMTEYRLYEIKNDLRRFAEYKPESPVGEGTEDSSEPDVQPVDDIEDIEEEESSEPLSLEDQLAAHLKEISAQMLEANRRGDYETRELLIEEHRRLSAQMYIESLREMDDETAQELGIEGEGLRPLIDNEGRLVY